MLVSNAMTHVSLGKHESSYDTMRDWLRERAGTFFFHEDEDGMNATLSYHSYKDFCETFNFPFSDWEENARRGAIVSHYAECRKAGISMPLLNIDKL